MSTQTDGTTVTSVSVSTDAPKVLPEGVEIMTSNTSTISLDPKSEAVLEVKEDEKPADNADEVLEQDIKVAASTREDIKKDLGSKSVDFDALEAEYEANGQLSPESYLALEKAGYPKSVVDAYTTGLEAKNDQYVARVTAMAGGPEALQAVSTFIASQGKDYVAAFNEVIDKGSLKSIELIIKGAQADMTKKYGTRNPSITGGGAPSQTVGYKNAAEAIAAAKDPRYGRDSAYTQAHRAKVGASKGLFA
jgi:hypothetical protein